MRRRWWTDNVKPASPTPGRVWRNVAGFAGSQWADICVGYPGGQARAVAVSPAGATRFAYSDDGKTWLPATAPSANQWRGVCWSQTLELYVAVSADGAQRVATSADGITWALSPAVSLNTWTKVIELPGITNYLVAVSSDNFFMYWNGAAWSVAAPIGFTGAPQGRIVRSGNDGYYVAGALTSNETARSADGATWTLSSAFPVAGAQNVRGVACGTVGSRWVAASNLSPYFMSSDDDGASWQSRTPPVGWTGNVSTICFAAGTVQEYLALASSGSGRCATSSDGYTWTQQTIAALAWQSVVFVPEWGARGRYIACEFAGTFGYSG